VRGASARSCAKTVRFSPAQTRFSPKSSTKVHQGLITKVVDHVTSYNFYKGQVVFFFTDRAQNACQDADSLGANEQCRTALTEVFHLFTLQIPNATQHESCVPRQNTQLLYWGNLKCLGKIWRTRQKFQLTWMGQQGIEDF
jgi:hypothetical protein